VTNDIKSLNGFIGTLEQKVHSVFEESMASFIDRNIEDSSILTDNFTT
jgi:hypothetical protein